MESIVQVTTKNPQKVEAGKKLAAFNKKKREELKIENVSSSEKSKTYNKSFSNSYGYIALAMTLGIAGVGIFMYNKTQAKITDTTMEYHAGGGASKSNKFIMD